MNFFIGGVTMQENTVTKEQIEVWKAQYGKVFRTYIDETPIYWRRLKRSEYKDIMLQTLDDASSYETNEERTKRAYARQELVAKTAVLYPENVDDLIENTAGFAMSISEEIMDHCGFTVGESQEL